MKINLEFIIMWNIINKINLKPKKIFYSILLGVVLTILNYELSDMPLFTGEDLNTLSIMQWITEKVTPTNVDKDLDKALFINTSHDKTLANVYDGSRYIGNTDITDRNKILRLLEKIDSVSYKYIILDIRFEKGVETSIDDSLFSYISHMNKIVVASHRNIQPASPILANKSAKADFYSTIVSTNFLHYQFYPSNEPSMPAFAYQEMTGKSIKKYWGFSTCENQLCQTNLFLHFGTDKFTYKKTNGDLRYLNLGIDILDNPLFDFEKAVKGKIIVIGNFEEDTHDTYAGKKPGSLITYRALTTLLAKAHLVPIWYIIFQLILFASISLTIFSKVSLIEKLAFLMRIKIPLIHFLISFIGYSSVLFVTSGILFLATDRVLSIFWISLFFSSLKNIITFNDKNQ